MVKRVNSHHAILNEVRSRGVEMTLQALTCIQSRYFSTQTESL